MKFAVCVISLGYTRLAGITLYDSVTRDFTETTPRVARELISKGLVKGVKWKDDGFVPDKDFNMQDILVKTGVGKYRPLLKDIPGEPVNSTYSVVRVIAVEAGKLYEVISNKCQRIKLTEEQLRGLNAIGNVSGVFITDEEIKICDGVVIEDRTHADDGIDDEPFEEILDEGEEEVYEIGDTEEYDPEENTEEVIAPTSMEELFSGLNVEETLVEETPADEKKKVPSKKGGSRKKK